MSLFALPSGNTSKKKSKNIRQGCEACSYQYTAKNPKMAFYGEGKKEILIVTDTPSEDDDFEGKPLTGGYGDLLKSTLRKFNAHITKDCWVTHAVRCSCDNITDVTRGQCSPNLMGEIRRLKPKVVILLGPVAVKSVITQRLSGRLAGTDPRAFYGEAIPDQDLQTWLFPTYHPQEIKATQGKFAKAPDPVHVMLWENNLEAAVEKAVDPKYDLPDYLSLQESTKVIWEVEDCITFLEDKLKLWEDTKEEIFFDYESSGLKNQATGHYLECVSISDSIEAVSLPFFRDNRRFCELYKAIMVSPLIGKTAQNDPYEDSWTYRRAAHDDMDLYKVENWTWDTMLGAHFIHNQKPVGQKFQTYVNFGILNYDSVIDKYLKAKDDKNKNAINNIAKAPKKPLYQYSAEDSLWGRMLMVRQKAWFKKWPHLLEGFQFLLRGELALSNLHINGHCFDVEEAINAKVTIEQDIRSKIADLRASEWGEGWNGKTGGDNIKNHVYKTLGLKNLDGIKTNANKDAFNEEVMEKMDHPFTDSILEIKKLEKILGTYLEGYIRETVDGICHPFFRLLTDTFRSNSDSPNGQNVPKRNKKIKNIIRKCIRPRPGHRYMAWDYKALETMIAACNYPDPNWIEYASDPTSDMHWDWSVNLFEFEEDFIDILLEECLKNDVRQLSKNQAVFPGIYGASDHSIALGLHKFIKRMPVMWEYFRSKGWDDLKVFKTHVKERYVWYWDVWFPTYKALRLEDYKKYLVDGYTDTLNDMRYHGPIDWTQFCNWKTQGPASHVKLWTLAEVEQEMKEEQMESKLIMEIHDEILADVVEGEEEEMDRMVRHIGNNRVREHWPWLIVPLVIEGEQSEIDGDWSVMKGF